MAPTKKKQIEIHLPQDILFAMRGLEKPGEVEKKVKIALAIHLFQERSISLGKATELSGLSRVKFMDILKNYGIPAYDYSEDDYESDRQATSKYLKALK